MKNNYQFKNLIFLLFSLLLIGATNLPVIKISGLQGDALLNIENHLKEIFKYQKQIESPDALKQHVTEALQPFGYLKPKIIIYENSKKRIRLHIIPGSILIIKSLLIKIEGEGEENPCILRELHKIKLKENTAFNNAEYENTKNNLLTAAEKEGFLKASYSKSEVLIDEDNFSAQITLILNTGKRFYFGPVVFNDTYIAKNLLYRYVPFSPGTPYSTEAINKFSSNLSQSGYFKSVIVKPDTTQGTEVPVQVTLEQIKKINYTIGGGYGTDTGIRGRAGLHITPLSECGDKFNLIAQGSVKENALLAQYLIPGRNPVVDRYSFSGGVSTYNYNTGYANSLQLSAAEQHSLTFFQRVLSLNLLHERFTYTYEPRTTKTLLYPKGAFSFRYVEKPLFSPSGYNISLTGLGAGKFLLSDINVIQGIFDAKLALRVDPLRLRFYFHTTQALTATKNINDLPLSLAPLLGGPENLKGYGINSIGPGRILNYFGFEIQKETIDNWYVRAFYDAGDVYNPSDRDFKYDIGLGIMWVSPVGPIKIALAQPVNKNLTKVKDRRLVFVLNIGPDL